MENMQVGMFIGAAMIGAVAWYVANKKNRNTFLWALLCFMFGIIPLLILSFLGRLPPKE